MCSAKILESARLWMKDNLLKMFDIQDNSLFFTSKMLLGAGKCVSTATKGCRISSWLYKQDKWKVISYRGDFSVAERLSEQLNSPP